MDVRPSRRKANILSHDTIHGGSLDPQNIQEVEAGARAFISGLSGLIRRHQNETTSNDKYVFGGTPTVLDAAGTALLARFMEMQRDDLMDDTVRNYALGVLGTDEWHKTTLGRPTVYHESLGKVADMKLF